MEVHLLQLGPLQACTVLNFGSAPHKCTLQGLPTARQDRQERGKMSIPSVVTPGEQTAEAEGCMLGRSSDHHQAVKRTICT